MELYYLFLPTINPKPKAFALNGYSNHTHHTFLITNNNGKRKREVIRIMPLARLHVDANIARLGLKFNFANRLLIIADISNRSTITTH